MDTGVEAGRYAAFISYSHKDAAAARALHARLERYRIPKRLVGTPGDHGPVPAGLTPIFRDRDELPAAGDLSEKVRGALAASDSLVVLCSPYSAGSIWVAREIAAFRELNPDRPILAAVVAGEPSECFPAGLGGTDAAGAAVEPLAADLRKAGDGRRLGFLKLVAGLTGVGLDALVQRDAARAMRRVTAVTLTALAATLVMAVLTVIAFTARQEADRQRAGAEGLVEFMLTDLREKLKGVGRIDVMDSVNQRAFTYYSSQQALNPLPDESLERLARVLHARGEDEISRGNMESALARFREAHAVTAATLARHPDDPKAIFAHGQSEYWIGRVYELREQWPECERQYALYAESTRRVLALAPGNPDYMLERGWGFYNLGIVQLSGTKNPKVAEKQFREAIAWFEKAGRARPDSDAAPAAIADSYGWLAESLRIDGRPKASLAARQDQLRVNAQRLAKDPGNAQRAYQLTLAERAVARGQIAAGDHQLGEALEWRAYSRANALVSRDRNNTEWLLLRTMIACDLVANTSGPRRAALRAEITAASATLGAQGNPRLVHILRCAKIA